MPQTIVQIDAFTDRPFAGNPAAVCILPGPADAAWMQDVARAADLGRRPSPHSVHDVSHDTCHRFDKIQPWPLRQAVIRRHALKPRSAWVARAVRRSGELDRLAIKEAGLVSQFPLGTSEQP